MTTDPLLFNGKNIYVKPYTSKKSDALKKLFRTKEGKEIKQIEETHKSIHKLLDADRKMTRHIQKILVIGPPNAGIKTLFRQIQTIFSNVAENRSHFIPQIHQNTLNQMQNLLCFMKYSHLPIRHPECSARILSNSAFSPAIASDILVLWQDPDIQDAYFQATQKTSFTYQSLEYSVSTSAQYLFDNITRLAASDYVPTHEDIVSGTFATKTTRRQKLFRGGGSSTMQMEGSGVDFSSNIPSDCLSVICSFLPLVSIRNLSLVNKTLSQKMQNESIWKYLCQVHFNVTNTNQSWKKLYLKLNKKEENSSVNEFQVEIDHAFFQIVGISVDSLPKYVHQFEDVVMVIFVADLSEYQLKNEDDQYKIFSTLNLFEAVCNSRWWSNTAKVLYLNKYDLFLEKLKKIPLLDTFPDYQGNSVDDAKRYVESRFTDLLPNQGIVYSHFTCAKDVNNVEVVFRATRDLAYRTHCNCCCIGLI